MKKILALLLASVLVFALVACSNKKDTTSKSDASTTQTKNESTDTNDTQTSEITSISPSSTNASDFDVDYAKSYDEFINNIREYYSGKTKFCKTFGPEEWWQYNLNGAGLNEEEAFETLEEEMKYKISYNESKFGYSFEFSIEEVKKDKLSTEKIKKIGEALCTNYDFIDSNLLTEGYKSVLKYHYKGNKGQNSENDSCYIVKYGDYWYSLKYSADENSAWFTDPL